MRGYDEILTGSFGVPRIEAPECVGTCLSRIRSDLEGATPDKICHDLQKYCESQALADFCNIHGVTGANFSWNPHLQCRHRMLHRHRHGKLHRQFWKAYDANPSLNLALAFHGTAEENVPKILHHGLDPHFRRTQAFGKGEYFSKEPGLAATYRHEGSCLVVFLLLMPQDHEKVFNTKDRDIIVVPDLSHELPLGVVRFSSLDEKKIQHSQDMRLAQRSLKQTAINADWRVAQAKLMAKLSQLLQEGRFEQAADELSEATKYHHVSMTTAQQLSALLHETIPDDKTRNNLFPTRAEVKPLKQGSDLSQPSVEELEVEAQEAWRAFLVMKMDPNRNILLDHPKTTTCAKQIQQQQQLPGVLVL